MKGYGEDNGITFTGWRPYRKNDNRSVEQTSWSVVRRFGGDARFDTDAAARTFAQLDQALSDCLTFFMPTMTLIEKVRDGARMHTRHDPARTPYERLLVSPGVDAEGKAALQGRARQLNPAALRRSTSDFEKRLERLPTPPPASRACRTAPGCGKLIPGPPPPPSRSLWKILPHPRVSHTAHNPFY